MLYASNYLKLPTDALANITIQKFFHTLDRNVECQYGGISMFDNHTGTFKEISNNCLSHYGVYRYRNIYPQSSTFLLLVYSYGGYGSINISLTISTHQCKVTKIKLCSCPECWNRHLSLHNTDCVVYQLRHEIDIGYYRKLADNGRVCNRCPNSEIRIPPLNAGDTTLTTHLSAYFIGL